MLINVDNVCKSFGSLQVLRGVSLSIERGEVVSIVGPSGAGKSTLLQIIGSLDRPDSGKILFGSDDITTFSEKRMAAFRNAHIGFVFQFHQLLPEFTMLENVALPAMIGGLPHRQATSRAMELIEYLGLRDRANHRPNALSGGERQRAAVARALINNPDVVLADEPSGSLDSHNRTELHRLFFDLRRDRKQTFVIVTHDEDLAADSDRIIHLADGMVQ